MQINWQALRWAIVDETKRRKISKTRLAEYVGVSRDTISRWSKSKGAPTTEQISRLAELLNLDSRGFYQE